MKLLLTLLVAFIGIGAVGGVFAGAVTGTSLLKSVGLCYGYLGAVVICAVLLSWALDAIAR